MTPDRFTIWQERGPCEDLFPVASTDALACLLDDWPFGAGHFHLYAEGALGPSAIILYLGDGKWLEESRWRTPSE